MVATVLPKQHGSRAGQEQHGYLPSPAEGKQDWTSTGVGLELWQARIEGITQAVTEEVKTEHS